MWRFFVAWLRCVLVVDWLCCLFLCVCVNAMCVYVCVCVLLWFLWYLFVILRCCVCACCVGAWWCLCYLSEVCCLLRVGFCGVVVVVSLCCFVCVEMRCRRLFLLFGVC